MARRKVTAAPVLSDWAAVDQALRDIRECQHALTELAVDRDRRLDSIKNEYAKTALPLQNRIKRLESDVKTMLTVTAPNGWQEPDAQLRNGRLPDQ